MYTTMIAFEADELSTVVGGGDIYFPMQKLAPFNVADLPCPPQSIMVCALVSFEKRKWADRITGSQLVQTRSRGALCSTPRIPFEDKEH